MKRHRAQDVIDAMQEGIKLAARKKYGHHLDIDCKIDRKLVKSSFTTN